MHPWGEPGRSAEPAVDRASRPRREVPLSGGAALMSVPGDWALGCDPHVAHACLAAASSREALAVPATAACSSQDDLVRRLDALYAAVRTQARRLARQMGGMPVCCVVERPIGRYPSPSLTMAAGVPGLALAHALPLVPVWQMSTGEWKRETVGNGTASKEAVAAWVADATGVMPGSDHEGDAMAMALAALRMWQDATDGR